MHEKLYPQLIEVDPMRIKFNERNPRKHQGTEFLRLKECVKEVGVVQQPTVRVLSGGFYECIDGEGRVKAAQEAGLSTIWVVSLGKVSDLDALIMLQAANVVRDFGYLAECRGLANLHRQGQSGVAISQKIGEARGRDVSRPFDATHIQVKIAIGYFPDSLIRLMQENGSEELQPFWTERGLKKLLALRQLQPGQKAPGELATGGGTPTWEPLDGVYDYAEVQRAIEKIIAGEIAHRDELSVYVEQRRRELFEQRFDEELRNRLEAELLNTRSALEASYAQKVEGIQEQTSKRYEAQVAILQQQYNDLEQQHQRLIKEVARRPEIIAQREADLQKKLKEAETERTRFQALQQEVQQEVQKAQQEAYQSIQSQLDQAIWEQRKVMERELAQVRIDLEAYYAQKDQDRQFRAEKTVRQAIAHGTELLCQSQQWLLLLISPAMVKSLTWLKEPDVISLLAQIKAVRGTLEQAEEVILHGDVSDSVPTDTEGEVPNDAYNSNPYQPSADVGYR